MVKVGAATETEMKEKKHRVEDALQATRAALEEGIVPGGGVALLNAQDAIDTSGVADGDESTGAEIIRRALEEPLRQIADNSGFEGSVVVDKVRGMKPGEGLNAESGDYGDLIKDGVIDPTMVTRSALQNAASIAKNILTTEAIVAEPPEKDGAGPGRRHARHGRDDVERLHGTRGARLPRKRSKGPAVPGPSLSPACATSGRRSRTSRTGSGSTPRLSASAVPRAVVIGTSISSASSQVAKTASPNSRRRKTRLRCTRPSGTCTSGPLPPRRAGHGEGDLVVGEDLGAGELVAGARLVALERRDHAARHVGGPDRLVGGAAGARRSGSPAAAPAASAAAPSGRSGS